MIMRNHSSSNNSNNIFNYSMRDLEFSSPFQSLSVNLVNNISLIKDININHNDNKYYWNPNNHEYSLGKVDWINKFNREIIKLNPNIIIPPYANTHSNSNKDPRRSQHELKEIQTLLLKNQLEIKIKQTKNDRNNKVLSDLENEEKQRQRKLCC